MKSARIAPKTKKAPKQAVKATSTLNVHLNFEHPGAKSVFIAGSFNAWHPAVTEMIHLGNGRWVKELKLEPGVYEYRLVVDGEWLADPKALETVPNPFGGVNSVLRV